MLIRLTIPKLVGLQSNLCPLPQWLHTTPALNAEPLKKKKKLDPQIIKQREDRRRKKLEKQIRRLEKNARQLKPIEELEVPLELIDEKELVERNFNCCFSYNSVVSLFVVVVVDLENVKEICYH